MSDGIRVLLAYAIVCGIVALIVCLGYVSVYGMPVMRGRWRAYRMRRTWRNRVAERALEILEEHPDIPFQCSSWPRWKLLCGQCCAVSRAETQLRDEQDAINRVIASSLREAP